MKVKEKNYKNLSQDKNRFIFNMDYGSTSDRVPPGSYTIHIDPMRGLLWLEQFDTQHDSILDLPSNEYKQITRDMEKFLSQETKQVFKEYGYIYKRSGLLYGEPGTGKTCIVHRVARDVVKMGGIVIYCNDPRLLSHVYPALDDVQPDILTLVVFEEFDSIAEKHETFGV